MISCSKRPFDFPTLNELQDSKHSYFEQMYKLLQNIKSKITFIRHFFEQAERKVRKLSEEKMDYI